MQTIHQLTEETLIYCDTRSLPYCGILSEN